MRTVTNLSRAKRIINTAGKVAAMKRREHRAMRRWVRQQDLSEDFGTPPRTKRLTMWEVC